MEKIILLFLYFSLLTNCIENKNYLTNIPFESKNGECEFIYNQSDADVDYTAFLNKNDSSFFEIILADSNTFKKYFIDYKTECSKPKEESLNHKFRINTLFFQRDSISMEITKVFRANGTIENNVICYGKERYCAFSWKSN